MKIEKFAIYLADLSPRFGTEPGKKRPVVVVQTDLINGEHASTIVCPITTNVVKTSKILRVHVTMSASGLKKPSDVLVDQVRAIDNKRFVKRLGKLGQSGRRKLLENLRIILFE